MDTRSVVRSRRRSTRLTGHPLLGIKQSTMSKRRHSDHDTSATASNTTVREGSCPQIASNSVTPSSCDANRATPDTNATTAVTKVEDEGLEPPLFPNLRSTKLNPKQASRNDSDAPTAAPKEPVETSSGEVVKGHVSTKWVKTARGSTRLASDSLPEGTRNDADKKWGFLKQGKHASPASLTRRSKRLKSMTPDVGKESVDVEHVHSRHIASKIIAITTTADTPNVAGSDAEQELGPEWQDPSPRATSEHNPTTYQTRHDEIPFHDWKPDRLLQESEVLQNTSPIPELVADIEKIIQASPIADSNLANHGTKRTLASTPAAAVKQRPHANMSARSRTLRSSSRSVESPSEMGKHLSSEKTDSESSQLDGAFDDSIRGRRKKKAEAAGSTAKTTTPIMPRGTKRSAEELSPDGGNADASSHRQYRKPDSNRSKPGADLSSASPIETARYEQPFSVGSPGLENPLSTGEPARRSDEPVNQVLPADMISQSQEEQDSEMDSNAADDGSQGASRRQSREGSPEGDTHKCADCGRSPQRYLVCAKCQKAIYCGKYCQIWNWPLHTTRCLASDEAEQGEIQRQEAYLGGMWGAALKVLKEEKDAGSTLDSMLLGEAVRHSSTRPKFLGQWSPRGSVALDVGPSQLAPHDPGNMDMTRAMSVRLAQATMGSNE